MIDKCTKKLKQLVLCHLKIIFKLHRLTFQAILFSGITWQQMEASCVQNVHPLYTCIAQLVTTLKTLHKRCLDTTFFHRYSVATDFRDAYVFVSFRASRFTILFSLRAFVLTLRALCMCIHVWWILSSIIHNMHFCVLTRLRVVRALCITLSVISQCILPDNVITFL